MEIGDIDDGWIDDKSAYNDRGDVDQERQGSEDL